MFVKMQFTIKTTGRLGCVPSTQRIKTNPRYDSFFVWLLNDTTVLLILNLLCSIEMKAFHACSDYSLGVHSSR